MQRISINGVRALLLFLLLWGVACSGSGEAGPQTDMVLTWGRYGGFAGFCDEMSISISGEVRIQSCRPKSEKVVKLSSEDSSRLDRWRKSFGSVVIESNDGAVADSMTIKLTLKGTGAGQPTEMQRREILEWAEGVYSRTKSGAQ
jgi:hypothetical protein